MHFYRTTNLAFVRSMLTGSEDYDMLGDDTMPVREDFVVNDHPGIWYVVPVSRDDTPMGLFSLFPRNSVCWEGHVMLTNWSSTAERWDAARGLVPWLAEQSECRRLTAEVPSFNRRALAYCTHGVGMKYVGTHERAFLKHRKLWDLIILGRSIDLMRPMPPSSHSET